MNTYIALLRGINVGGHTKIKMAELREMLQQIGLNEVATYIQSGNIVFVSEEVFVEKLEAQIKKGILDRFNFEVPVLLFTNPDFARILETSPFKDQADLDANRIYYSLYKGAVSDDHIGALKPEDYPNERFKIEKNCVYLNCKLGAGKAKLNNNIIEKKLRIMATTRNHRTMCKLLELSS